MRSGSLLWLVVLAGCPGGNGGVGDRCSGNGDCGNTLQCVDQSCAPLCANAPQCGAGYSCDANGYCQPATLAQGDACTSEDSCAAGLSCEIANETDMNGALISTCLPSSSGHPAGALCAQDSDCHNDLCELGRCVDMCNVSRDCGDALACVQIPREAVGGVAFMGCLQADGLLAWSIPLTSPQQVVALPVPSNARSVALTMSVGDPEEEVGVVHLVGPDDGVLFDATEDLYTQAVRHVPALGQSVLAMPSSTATKFGLGEYQMTISSLRPPFTDPVADVGDSVPQATAVFKLDSSVVLDLHFYFLNLDDFPCANGPGDADPAGTGFIGGTFDAEIAKSSDAFQTFVADLEQVFASGGVSVEPMDYNDLREYPDLDGLDVTNAGELLALGTQSDGINVFFVRSLSPAGLVAFGPNPGPAGLGGTPQSGVVIALDSLCYRSWIQIAHVAEHEIAHYMGLYDNATIDSTQLDPIGDDMSSTNLMFYSELGGSDLSDGQRTILGRSTVLP